MIGKILASAAAVALVLGMTAASAAPVVHSVTAGSQLGLVAAKKKVAKKAVPAKKVARRTLRKAKRARKNCGTGMYHKKGKCVDAATNPVTPKPAKKAKKVIKAKKAKKA